MSQIRVLVDKLMFQRNFHCYEYPQPWNEIYLAFGGKHSFTCNKIKKSCYVLLRLVIISILDRSWYVFYDRWTFQCQRQSVFQASGGTQLMFRRGFACFLKMCILSIVCLFVCSLSFRRVSERGVLYSFTATGPSPPEICGHLVYGLL